ncbi:MAG TPA: N-6 DNA methylase [Ktedonobacteraceae bacterium]|nr:N-6 DNA methylase [Ktedonobacteraceae bacterium]
MSSPEAFTEFLSRFFGLFSQKTFGRVDYLTYLEQGRNHGGDEAPIVDTAIIGPLLGLLGFSPAERVYNQQRSDERPDFAPTDPVYGICFVVEDKNTSLTLNCDVSDPESHLSQLARYVLSTATYYGWLTNGRQIMVWDFHNRQHSHCIIDIDLPAAIREWRSSQPPSLSPPVEKSLHDLYDMFRKEVFTDPQRLENDLGCSLEEWQAQALPLGTGAGYETALVEMLQTLVMELQGDARRTLTYHLTRATEYSEHASRLEDNVPELATQKLRELRGKCMSTLIEKYQLGWGLETEDISGIEAVLLRLEQEYDAFFGPKEVLAALLPIVNAARKRKYAATKPKFAQPIPNFDGEPPLHDALQLYTETVFAWHRRRALLTHDYRDDRYIHDEYRTWATIVEETTLGGLDEEQRRDEFALQAAYVVFIRLLLIRVCEDKGIFPQRFISDGGLKHWQEDIERYFVFAQGNPYDPLLDMAYKNAQNIYAHFFTGRELFNWYRLDREHFVMALHRLSRFNFAGVDSDIIGTIYNTYVSRKEKREKGQYYTPIEIVNYILDNVGYSGKAVIGSQKRLIDPACGSGSFLVAAAKRLITAYQNEHGKVEDPVATLERVRQNLFGFDLNPFACYLAEVNLLIQVLDLVKQAHDAKQRPTVERFHIYNVDALTRPTGRYYYTHFNTLLAEENDYVEQIKSRAADTPYANGFAFVVANPPYGATLSDSYKETLRTDWADVFYGQPDTYIFFLKLGTELLANNGKLGFITPNTYLMGTNTPRLRNILLNTGRVEQIVDLPQGIWQDVNVDCVLLFLAREADEDKRRAQQVRIHMLGLRDTLDKLTERTWTELLTQSQSRWMDDAQNKINIRYDALLQHIEEVCCIKVNGGSATKVLRLIDVTESTQGIIPYKTQDEGRLNRYITSQRDIPTGEDDWKPLLDGKSFIGRYELYWENRLSHIKYGDWLWCSRESKYFDSPKLLVQDMRNRALKRRLVATFDEQKFYNRHNFSDIIAKDASYDLKYILALFNSSLLNYWFARQFDNVHINPSYFRQLPIYPADATTQAQFVTLVDAILAKQATLNILREQGYTIKTRRDGTYLIEVPYDGLLSELQKARHNFPVVTLFDARSLGLFQIPERCDLNAAIGSNVYIPEKYPTSLVLRHNKLWFEVRDDDVRRYLYGYLKRSHWQGKTWDDMKNAALIPEDAGSLSTFFALEAQKIRDITTLLNDIKQIDREIDERVLDLYGITDSLDRQRVLGSAPIEEEEVGSENVPEL